jgi:transcriptional regulator with XRE-family HTH domain
MLTEEHLTFAEALIAFRRRLGASQASLGRASGVAQASLSLYERGRGYPTLLSFRRLVAALDLTEAETLKLLACVPCPSTTRVALPPQPRGPKPQASRECPPELEPLLGYLSDGKAGELAGLLSPATPKRWRQERGIPPRRGRVLSLEEESRVTEVLRLHFPNGCPDSLLAPRPGAKRKECPPHLEPLLGLITDREMARLAPCGRPLAARWREERGIFARRRRLLSREEETRLAEALQNVKKM